MPFCPCWPPLPYYLSGVPDYYCDVSVWDLSYLLVDSVVQRGERLELLVEKTDDLNATACIL